MASASIPLSSAAPAEARILAGRFAAAALCVAGVACLLAGWAPLGFSIVTVFLFAGPHNWLEARYFMSRMPGRWGALRGYYLTGLVGVLGLTAAFAMMPGWARRGRWDGPSWDTATAAWNTALVLWVLALVHLRSRQNPRRDWAWLTPIGLTLVAATWLWPREWGLALVYLHPLMALWFLDRELGRQRMAWRGAYRRLLLCVPALMAALWWKLADAPPLDGQDALSLRIAAHAGADILTGLSSHLLVAWHTFLEMLHYGVWVVAMPLLSLPSAPWTLSGVPLARRTVGWRRVLVAFLAVGAVVVLSLWACFLADYPLTRDVYFTVAMLHVLAEVPFLLRLL